MMTKSFDEWRNEQRNKVDGYTERDAYEAGQQSKQAEIDELKREMLNKTNEAYADGQKSMRKMIKSNKDELQKRIDDALKAMEVESENSWGLWKEKADMYEQGASNAYEKSYWILKGNTNDH